MTQFKHQENYNVKITTETGEEFLVYANWLHNNHLDEWQGWRCEAGATRLLIDKDLKVYSGECKNDYLGSAIDGFELLDHTICKQSRCTGCTDDLTIEKSKIFPTLV